MKFNFISIYILIMLTTALLGNCSQKAMLYRTFKICVSSEPINIACGVEVPMVVTWESSCENNQYHIKITDIAGLTLVEEDVNEAQYTISTEIESGEMLVIALGVYDDKEELQYTESIECNVGGIDVEPLGVEQESVTEQNPLVPESGENTDDNNGEDTVTEETKTEPYDDSNDGHWQKFKEFHFREEFTLIYSGPPNQNDLAPLRHGFTHIDLASTNKGNGKLIPPQNRAILWTGISGNYGQSQWRDSNSPWNNDMNLIESKWNAYMKDYASLYGQENGLPNVDIIALDIEARIGENDHVETNTKIADFRKTKLSIIPEEFKVLSDDSFVLQYKLDMANLYTTPMDWLRNNNYNGKIASYDHALITRKYWEISPYADDTYSYKNMTWQEWLNDKTALSYLFKNNDTINKLDMVNPNCYFFYNYPPVYNSTDWQWTNAGDYLAYYLFQIEINVALTDKPVVPFLWLNFHEGGGTRNVDIKPHMAEASAIFSFFAGAKGFWLWDITWPNLYEYAEEETYDYFIHGLERISEYSYIMDGEYEVYMPQDYDPITLIQKHKPVWRGIVKDNKLLVTAHNPYATDESITTMEIIYKDKSITTIQIKGKEIYLGLFDI